MYESMLSRPTQVPEYLLSDITTCPGAEADGFTPEYVWSVPII